MHYNAPLPDIWANRFTYAQSPIGRPENETVRRKRIANNNKPTPPNHLHGPIERGAKQIRPLLT